MLARGKPRDTVLDDDHRAIDDQAEVERAEAHQIARDAQPVHADGRHQHRDRDDQGRDNGGPDIAEQEEQHRDNQQGALDQVFFDRGDRRIDKRRAVIDNFCHHAVG